MGHYTSIRLMSAALAVMGVLTLPSYAITGLLMIAAGVSFAAVPILASRRSGVSFDGNVLRITGSVTDISADVSGMRSVTHRESVEPERKIVGNSDRKRFDGHFYDGNLGDIWMAVNREVPMCIVLDCGDRKCVFNDTDVARTKELYDRLYSAIREK